MRAANARAPRKRHALCPSGTGKTHAALGLGLAACQKGLPVGFTTAAALLSEMTEARDERRLLRFHKQMAGNKLNVDELGLVPLSRCSIASPYHLSIVEMTAKAIASRKDVPDRPGFTPPIGRFYSAGNKRRGLAIFKPLWSASSRLCV